eukprot:UN17012
MKMPNDINDYKMDLMSVEIRQKEGWDLFEI